MSSLDFAASSDKQNNIAIPNETQTIVSKLSAPEKEYIVKLGKSSGRDIVPIRLEIYRSLMGFDLIVDKGRRLALSKLGQEILRYL